MSGSHRGVPVVRPMKRRDLEGRADRLIRDLYPDHYATPGPVPIQDLFEFDLTKRFRVLTHVTDRLPLGVEGMSFPPGASGPQGLILLADSVYDNLCDQQPRARFTAAHECSHGLLHLSQIPSSLLDGNVPALFRRQELPRFRDPEWQADVFAGTLLMPTPAVRAFVDRYGADAVAMAETFNVSVRAAELRLHFYGAEGLSS